MEKKTKTFERQTINHKRVIIVNAKDNKEWQK